MDPRGVKSRHWRSGDAASFQNNYPADLVALRRPCRPNSRFGTKELVWRSFAVEGGLFRPSNIRSPSQRIAAGLFLWQRVLAVVSMAVMGRFRTLNCRAFNLHQLRWIRTG